MLVNALKIIICLLANVSSMCNISGTRQLDGNSHEDSSWILVYDESDPDYSGPDWAFFMCLAWV